MLDHWLTTHHQIAKYLCSNKGLELMYKDSQIAEMVIKHFTDRGIMIFCVHDSFIAARRYKDELSVEMETAYQGVLNNKYIVPMDSKECPENL